MSDVFAGELVCAGAGCAEVVAWDGEAIVEARAFELALMRGWSASPSLLGATVMWCPGCTQRRAQERAGGEE